MTTALADFQEPVSPTAEETQLARESSQRLAKFFGGRPRRTVRCRVEAANGDEETVSIPEAAFRLLNGILAEMAKGNAVTLIPVHAELTTQEAADLLKVSRPFLVEQLEKNLIPHRMVGTHRRVRFSDVMDYKHTMERRRREALDELSALDQELGFD